MFVKDFNCDQMGNNVHDKFFWDVLTTLLGSFNVRWDMEENNHLDIFSQFTLKIIV